MSIFSFSNFHNLSNSKSFCKWGGNRSESYAPFPINASRKDNSIRGAAQEKENGSVLVPGTGLEPARLAALDPKSSASANSAIPARNLF
jgi:hypothetical protein